MGLYDRDYYRDEPRKRGAGLSAVVILILLNVGLYVMNMTTSNGALFNRMALYGPYAANPLQWYRCLTYAFAHDPHGFMHILFNMLTLFFFGPHIERKYGKAEFMLFYLLSAVFGGVVWNLLHFGQMAGAIGASGAVTAVVILFALNFPNVRILLWGILPLPAYVAGILFVLWDMFGASSGGDNIAHEIHLSGAVFAVAYFMMKIRFVGLLGIKNIVNGPRLARHTTGSEKRPTYSFTGANASASDVDFAELEKKVDDILRKITRSGEESLTEKERETLRFASREYQKRKGGK